MYAVRISAVQFAILCTSSSGLNSLEVNVGIMSLKRPCLLPSKYLPIYHSLSSSHSITNCWPFSRINWSMNYNSTPKSLNLLSWATHFMVWEGLTTWQCKISKLCFRKRRKPAFSIVTGQTTSQSTILWTDINICQGEKCT